MAYPFPRPAGSPHTPQHIKGMSSPRSSYGRGARPPCTPTRVMLALFVSAICLSLLLWSRGPSPSLQLDRIPFPEDSVVDYLAHFEGHQDCGLSSSSLYVPPPQPPASTSTSPGTLGKTPAFCPNRASLLEALSGGGRHGFDAPFFPKRCHYRWYTAPEICMILERFDAVVFAGDDMLGRVYAAFNMLLRENVALGGLKQWEMSEAERGSCRCENQFVKGECARFAVGASKDVVENDVRDGHSSPYACQRTPHVYLHLTSSPAPTAQLQTLSGLLSSSATSYRPIPIIHSLSLGASLSWPLATSSMDELQRLADDAAEPPTSARRRVPFLWLGPVAAGHLKPPAQILSQGNNALWHYTVEMAKEARARGFEALGMYNLTLQASSWDGSSYGVGVGLVQAMMVINWLARLEST